LLATAVSVAILAKTGNAGKLRFYAYADHIWATSGGCEGGDREEEMRLSSYGTAQRWGGFDLSVFYNARRDTTLAVDKLVALINASSAGDPLWIIGAGPMEVVGRAIQKSDPAKRQYATLISHSSWNNNHADAPSSNESHSGWTWDEIGELRPTVKLVKIKDQNPGLNTPYSTYHAWRDSSDPKLRWLWDRGQLIGKSWFDCSDAGMVYWLVNGRGSDQVLTPAELLALLAASGGGTPPPDDGEPPPDDGEPPPDDGEPPPDDGEPPPGDGEPPPAPRLLDAVPIP
jgi:hypothetical protein